MENLEGIVRLVDREFGEMIQKGKFRSVDDVELVYKMMDIVKDAYCAMKYEAELGMDNYSEYGGYPYENSYARGRNAKRNSMGQYNRTNEMGVRGTSYNGVFRSGRGSNYSYENAKEEYLENLREMVDDAPNDEIKDRLQRMIDDMMEQ